MPVQPAALELLTALAPVLARWGRWYVFDAQAVIAYGVPRLSADVDVTLSLAPEAAERFARDMEAAGFSLRVDDSEFDLIIAKVLADRPKDLEDASGLWRLHGRAIDASRIRHSLQLLETALGQSDLVRTFDAIAR